MANLTVIFDTRHRGFTFDCIIFFVLADIVRELNDLQGLDIFIFTQGLRKKTEREWLYSDDEKIWRVRNIIAQIPLLLPATNSITVGRSLRLSEEARIFPVGYHPEKPTEGATYVFQPREFLPLSGKGIDIARLRACPHATKIIRSRLKHDKFVTISLRKSNFQEARNSNLDAWKESVKVLDALGYYAYFIPDFEDLNQCLQDDDLSRRVLVDATSDINLRMAYYSAAMHNFCVSNGTSALLYFSKYYFSMFGIVREGVNNCGLAFLKGASGLNLGEKYFWLSERQHFVYSDDSFKNIKEHLDALVGLGHL